jgi:hypothetical protein
MQKTSIRAKAGSDERSNRGERILAPLNDMAARSSSLVANHHARFTAGGERFEVARYSFIGPKGGGKPIRLGIFAGVHGDEPEGVYALIRFVQFLEQNPAVAKGYALTIYPICNPAGFEARTRHNSNGRDLNREFWKNSAEPEVKFLEGELESENFDGIIALHTDIESNGFYGFARGATLTRQLLRPALTAAANLLPINQDQLIDGFHAEDGLIMDCYSGVLSAPPKSSPKPFEVILETPGQAPLFLREAALVVSLRAILEEYSRFISYAADL